MAHGKDRALPSRPEGIEPMSRPRILELCLSTGHGGLELYAARLAGRLMEEGHDCVAMAAEGTRFAARLDEQGTPWVPFRVGLRKVPLLSAVRLARFIERASIDVIHIHWSNDLPLAALAKRLCRRPVRLVHSRHIHLTRPKKNPYHRLLYTAVDLYVVLTRAMYEDARRHLPLPADAIELVHLGVPAPAAHAAASARDAGDTALEVGQFSRIERGKGQHLLIQAVDIARRSGAQVHASIFGHVMDEGYMAFLRAEVDRLGLGEQVGFHAFHPAPQERMPGFDAVVVASENETFGLVLIEAMRAGVCVIGSDAGGVPEIIEDGVSGLLFESGSARSLSRRLEYLARDPDARKRLAQAGKARADRDFSEEAHLRKITAALLRQVPGQ